MSHHAEWELLVEGHAGTVIWNGPTGEKAARFYALAHPGAVVLAWRRRRYPIRSWDGREAILEPGDPGWSRP